MTDFKADLPRPSKRSVVIAFLMGAFLGAAVVLAVVRTSVRAVAHASYDHPVTVATPIPASPAGLPNDRPSLAEARDYLDGKTFIVSPEAAEPSTKSASATITIAKSNITDMEWNSAGNSGGNYWSHRYSFLYDDNGKHYVVDASIDVQQIGSSMALMGFQVQKVTPGYRIRGKGSSASTR